jgi:polysaccharide biosynthesis/export protein
MRQAFIALALVIALMLPLAAQAGQADTKAEAAAASSSLSETGVLRVAQAMSTPDYPVTPGDSYALSFITSAGPVAGSLVVDVGYSVGIPNIGTIDARGATFADFKGRVEKRVLEAYPLSSPRLILQSCGVFPVYVQGEVPAASIVYLWGLSRLSDLWQGVTAYASNRDVRVRSAGGATKAYDLYAAARSGDLAQDPRLRPGDTVTFVKYSRSVSVQGEVRRPGVYQLLPSEGLRELVEAYCDGFTPKADAARLKLVRLVGGSSSIGEARILDFAKDSSLALMDSDAIAVPPLQDNLPVVYFEGALGVGADGTVLDASQRIPYTFYPGETLSQAVQGLRAQFSAVSDLAAAYVSRNGGKHPVDLSAFLYSKDYRADLALSPGDVIVVPFRQLFVFVSGAVRIPGRYPYIPDRRWDYYVSVAGGFDLERNSGQKVSILDQDGRSQGKDRLIQPEDVVVAAQNNALYNIGKFATITSTAVSLVALIVSLIRVQ